MDTPFRLSRIRHPRTSAGAILLLLAVFVLFGLVAPLFTGP
jgi:hypothetical protein